MFRTREVNASPALTGQFQQFEKILVLNMPERGDKRDAMTLVSSLSGLKVDYIDGVRGETVPNKALPVGQEDRTMTDNRIGSWRAHMNTIRT